MQQPLLAPGPDPLGLRPITYTIMGCHIKRWVSHVPGADGLFVPATARWQRTRNHNRSWLFIMSSPWLWHMPHACGQSAGQSDCWRGCHDLAVLQDKPQQE